MSCPVKVYFTSKLKNCFVNISSLLQKDWSNIWKDENGVKAIHLDCQNKSFYISWGGHTCQPSSEPRSIEISRKFGELLGLVEGQEVVATALGNVPSCSRISFYPASQSDWEIAETNSSLIESILINQLRVVWEGEKIPIWIQKSNCLVVTIGELHPSCLCAQIEEYTEVHIIPWKDVPCEESETKGLDIPLRRRTSPTSTDSENSTADSSLKSSEPSSFKSSTGSILTNTTELSSLRNSLRSLNVNSSESVSSVISNSTTESSSLKSSANDLRSISALKLGRSLNKAGDKYEQTYTPSFNADLRTHPLTARFAPGVFHLVKSMVFGPHSADVENIDKFPVTTTTNMSQATYPSMQHSKKTSLSRTPDVPIRLYYRVQNLAVCDDVMTTQVHCIPNCLLEQPSTVFVYCPDVACVMNRMSNTKVHGDAVSEKYVVIIASIHKLYSVKERKETSPTKMASSNDSTPNEDLKNSDPVKLFERKRLESSLNNKQRNVSSGERGSFSSLPATIVRLVLTSQRNFDSLLKEDLLYEHVAINSLTRRQLKLGVKATVHIRKIQHKASILLGLVLNPFGDSAKKIKSFSNSHITSAFTSWILETTLKYPLILASRMLIEFNINPDVKCEFLLSGIGSDSPISSTTQTKMQYFEVSEQTLCKASVTVGEVIQPSYYLLLSPYPVKNTQNLDAEFIKSPISTLGGFDELFETCVDFLLHGLAHQPISQQLYCSNKPNCSTLLLYGSGSTAGGAGKTSLAHALCNTLGKYPYLAHVSVIECVSLRGKRVETIRKSWQQTFNNAAWHQPAIILFDDLDQLISAPSLLQEHGPEAHYSLRLAQVFKTFLREEIAYNSKVVIIATATSRDSVHPTLLTSHGNHVFNKSVEIPLPNLDQRVHIIDRILNRKDLFLPKDVLRKIAMKTEGCSPQDLNTLVTRAVHSSTSRQSSSDSAEECSTICWEDFTKALATFKPASLHGIKLHQGNDLKWHDVGGLKDIKQALRETLEWPAKYPELHRGVPMRLPSGILLYGPPGCGKTMLAGVVARECSLNFISIKGPELLNKYIGASEQAVRDLFHRAQSAKPCILFFDEFDSMAPKRGHDSTGVTDRVVNQLLTQLDGVEDLDGVYILGASSRPDLIDPALLRPGRLGKSLYCGMPDENARLEILRALSSKLDLEPDVDLEMFAKETEDFSGADLKALLSNAQLERIHNMKTTISDKPAKYEVERTNIVYIPQLKDGTHRLNADENAILEKQVAVLQDNFFKNVYGKANHSPKPILGENIRIQQDDIVNALRNMAPSVTPKERMKYESIYQSFKNLKNPSAQRKPQVMTQRATLA